MKAKLALLSIFILTLSMKSDKPAYLIYDSKGKMVKYHDMIKAAEAADIVFFGESHDNPICHWLELQITKDLYEIKKDQLILGAEMFEADNQLILTEYVTGKIRKRNFEQQARLWPNYKTDYRPLVEFAKEKGMKFIATNIPRRYASIVYKKGFGALDSLDKEAKQYFPPLPIIYDTTLESYRDMMVIEGKGMMEESEPDTMLPKAQAIKDATMAYFILRNWSKGKTFIHFNGSYHSDIYEGIVWYTKQENPDLKIVTITSVHQENIEKLDKEYFDQADFIICIPEDMTTTY